MSLTKRSDPAHPRPGPIRHLGPEVFRYFVQCVCLEDNRTVNGSAGIGATGPLSDSLGRHRDLEC